MGPDEARRVDAVLRALAIEGVVAPTDPENPGGTWQVYDCADPAVRRDVSADVLAAVVGHFRDQVLPPPPRAESPVRGPQRGFVIPPRGVA